MLLAIWTWYQIAVRPLGTVLGQLDYEGLRSVARPPTLPVFLVLALPLAWSLYINRRPLVHRLSLSCLLGFYLWNLAGMLDLRTRPTSVPVVLVTRVSSVRPVCGLLIRESQAEADLWQAQFARGSVTRIPRSEIGSIRFGSVVDLLSVAIAAARDSRSEFPDCSSLFPVTMTGLPSCRRAGS